MRRKVLVKQAGRIRRLLLNVVLPELLFSEGASCCMTVKMSSAKRPCQAKQCSNSSTSNRHAWQSRAPALSQQKPRLTATGAPFDKFFAYIVLAAQISVFFCSRPRAPRPAANLPRDLVSATTRFPVLLLPFALLQTVSEKFIVQLAVAFPPSLMRFRSTGALSSGTA